MEMTSLDAEMARLTKAVDVVCEDVIALRAQRDELLAALKYVEGYLIDTLSPCDADCECVLHPVQAAIAKVEGR